MHSFRMLALDSFRGLAILAVIIYHWGFLTPLQLGIPFEGPLAFAPYIAAYGWLGVELFFMISGFLILMTLEGSRGAADFAARRFARLYPAYIVASALTFVLASAIAPALYDRTLSDLAASPLVDAPVLGAHHVSAVYWSLVAEGRFYVWICAIYFLFRRRFDRAWISFCAASYVVALLLPAECDDLIGAEYLPFFTFGIGFLRLRQSRKGDSFGHFAAAAVGLALLWSSPSHDCDPRLIIGVIAGLVLLFALFATGRLDSFSWRPLLYLGRISYPLYLVHDEIGIAVMRRTFEFGAPAYLCAFFALTAVIGLAHGLHVLVEVPGQRMLRRWLSHRPTPFVTCLEHRGARALPEQGAHS